MTVETLNLLSANEQILQRREKLKKLRQQGWSYPNKFRRDSLAHALVLSYGDKNREYLEDKNVFVKVAGRIMTKRVMGKASFVHVQDMSGKIQVYIRKDDIPENSYEEFLYWDLGDIIGIVGVVFKTKTGELSIKAQELFLLTKSLIPLPEKFHGLIDHETCYRQRYLDLIANPKTREIFRIRSSIVAAMRNFFVTHGFLEVETPMMQAIPGGAIARPFVTHHNTLDMHLYLRIAPELYLKRLVVGGMEKVFEINRNFRNEGISPRHNPEFTMLEFYWAYADYHDLMDFTEEMFRYLSLDVLGATTIKYQESEIDLSQSFNRMTLKESLVFYNKGIAETDFNDINRARQIAEDLGITVDVNYGLGKIQYEIFEKTVEKELKVPTFITAYPVEVSPLARANDNDPFVSDRFEIFIGGREIGNGFSELNDPEDQASRFRSQAGESACGDNEAMRYDEDYITALAYGMPPTAGEGIGIDRIAMLFADVTSIRDVILFPLLRSL